MGVAIFAMPDFGQDWEKPAHVTLGYFGTSVLRQDAQTLKQYVSYLNFWKLSHPVRGHGSAVAMFGVKQDRPALIVDSYPLSGAERAIDAAARYGLLPSLFGGFAQQILHITFPDSGADPSVYVDQSITFTHFHLHGV